MVHVSGKDAFHMSIRIQFLHKVPDEDSVALGRITLGEFVEEFEMILSFWNRERYEKQWRDGLQKILEGALRSCFITSVWNENGVFGCEWWRMYRIGEQVAIQNQLIRPHIFNQSFENFNPDNPYPSIQDHHSFDEDGQQISEWLVRFDQIQPLPK